MQPKTQWKFTADLEQIDVPRIVREANEAAGGTAKCVRLTIDSKVYTLVHRSIALVEPKTGMLMGHPSTKKDPADPVPTHPHRSPHGRVLLSYHKAQNAKPWYSVLSHVLYRGDVVKEHLDTVKTLVEVF